MAGWMGGGPFQPSCAGRRLNRRCLLYRRLLSSLAILYFIVRPAYAAPRHVAAINGASDARSSSSDLPFGFSVAACRISGSFDSRLSWLDHFYVAPRLGSPITIRCRTFGAAAP